MAAEALLFPGQGSHAHGMEEPYRGNALFERGLELLGAELGAVADLAAQLGLTVANDNAPGQVVLSGRLDAVAVAEEHAREIGARARRLDVGGAFHSPLMEPAIEPLAAALAGVDFRASHTPIYSCGTAAPFV